VLIRQGEESPAIHFVLEGELSIALGAVDAEPIAVMGAGETVGELGVITGEPATAFALAKTRVEVLSLDEEAFWELVQTSHPFAVNLIIKLAERMRRNTATIASNIDKRRLYERAAMFDGLTGIHNRRWLDETLHRMVERHERGGESLCLALIDIDHFKKFNDGHGHDAGDVVLSAVATAMAKNLRPTDLVARFGGEEFVILFPNTSAEQAQAAGERVRAVVEKTSVSMPDGKALPRVTISMGIATLKTGEKPSELLKAADVAMYEAKQGGRNRIVLSSR
jgi:diguanylate cyclase (GGDEF)-like protein